LAFPLSALAQLAICAQVKIEILQELTLEREAFEARMTINNGMPGVALENLSVDYGSHAVRVQRLLSG
jgi:hypothetical protein